MENREKDLDPRILKVAEKLKELRLKKYSSHESFAWENGLNRVQYWRMEKGTNFTFSTLLKILDAHKVPLNDFFKEFD